MKDKADGQAQTQTQVLAPAHGDAAGAQPPEVKDKADAQAQIQTQVLPPHGDAAGTQTQPPEVKDKADAQAQTQTQVLAPAHGDVAGTQHPEVKDKTDAKAQTQTQLLAPMHSDAAGETSSPSAQKPLEPPSIILDYMTLPKNFSEWFAQDGACLAFEVKKARNHDRVHPWLVMNGADKLPLNEQLLASSLSLATY